MRQRGSALCLCALLVMTACEGEPEAPGVEGVPPRADALPLPAEPPQSEMPRRSVTLLLPSTQAEGLRAIPAEIYSTTSSVDQAKQVVGLLLAPATAEGVVAPFPEGTLLRSIFLDGRGGAFVSLSREALTRAPGGSAWELLAISSLAGTLQRSMPGVKRVQLLIEGQEIETLTGHLDLRGPVSLDDRLVTEP